MYLNGINIVLSKHIFYTYEIAFSSQKRNSLEPQAHT